MMTRPFGSEIKPHADKVLQTIESGTAAATSMVAASWARSLNVRGLAPDLSYSPIRHDDRDLRERRDSLARLLHVSPSSLDRLFSTVSLAGCGIFLCDSEGVILHQMSASGDETDFEKAGLAVGNDWSERLQGTNGIGTCIVEGRPVTIQFDQHFHASNTVMSCMGAPMFGAEGELSAVLDISSCRRDMTSPMVQLISSAVCDTAGQIEADHFCEKYAGTRILRGEGDKKRAPVLLAVDSNDLVIGATRAARKQYGLPIKAVIDPKPATDLIGDSESRGVGLESAERREMKRAIARAGGNMSEAARQLGVSRATFYRRATKLGLLE